MPEAAPVTTATRPDRRIKKPSLALWLAREGFTPSLEQVFVSLSKNSGWPGVRIKPRGGWGLMIRGLRRTTEPTGTYEDDLPKRRRKGGNAAVL